MNEQSYLALVIGALLSFLLLFGVAVLITTASGSVGYGTGTALVLAAPCWVASSVSALKLLRAAGP